MPKYIDANALQKRMEQIAEESKLAATARPMREDTPSELLRYGTARAMIEWLNEIPAADVEPKRKWIPVTERFPEPVSAQTRRKTKPVLLYSPKGGFYVGWYFGKEEYSGRHIFANRTSKDSLQYITTKVTHWMLLP